MHPPKVVHCYPNANRQRCLYRLYEKYVDLLPVSGKCQSLYLYGCHNPLPTVWYEDRPVGVNSLCPIISRLCTLAGLEGGKFVNGSLISGSCTRMFDKNQPEHSNTECKWSLQ